MLGNLGGVPRLPKTLNGRIRPYIDRLHRIDPALLLGEGRGDWRGSGRSDLPCFRRACTAGHRRSRAPREIADGKSCGGKKWWTH